MIFIEEIKKRYKLTDQQANILDGFYNDEIYSCTSLSKQVGCCRNWIGTQMRCIAKKLGCTYWGMAGGRILMTKNEFERILEPELWQDRQDSLKKHRQTNEPEEEVPFTDEELEEDEAERMGFEKLDRNDMSFVSRLEEPDA